MIYYACFSDCVTGRKQIRFFFIAKFNFTKIVDQATLLQQKLPKHLCDLKSLLVGAAAYQLGNTSSCTIPEVKQRGARLVLGWKTVQVLPECCC